MKEQEERKKLAKKIERRAEKRGDVLPTYHVVYCTQSGCCKDKGEAKAVEKLLNRGTKQLAEKGIGVELTSSDCLNFCVGGPIVVVYPEGIWYGAVTPEVCTKIIENHLAKGAVVEEFVVARRPLVAITL